MHAVLYLLSVLAVSPQPCRDLLDSEVELGGSQASE